MVMAPVVMAGVRAVAMRMLPVGGCARRKAADRRRDRKEDEHAVP
jgi:hypothetical protein